MEQKTFKSGAVAPVSGNYQFQKHDVEVKDCIPRHGAYLHLRKGMKLPVHDDCRQPCIYLLMTVTDEDNQEKIVKGM